MLHDKVSQDGGLKEPLAATFGDCDKFSVQVHPRLWPVTHFRMATAVTRTTLAHEDINISSWRMEANVSVRPALKITM